MAENTQQSLKGSLNQTLNIRSPALKGMAEDTSEGLREAVKRHMLHKETFEEAWERIFALKNTEAEVRKLHEVKQAMEDGSIERSSERTAKKFSRSEALELHAIIAEREKAEILRKMVEDTPDNYQLITTASELSTLIDALSEESEVAVDTETTGVDVYTDVIVGMSITLPNTLKVPLAEKGWNVYIPVAHDEGEQLERDYVLSELHGFLYDETIGKVLHNAIFDIAMFRRHGSDLKGVIWDTQTAMHMLNENEPSYKLKDLAPRYLRVEADTFDELFGKDAKFNEMSLELALVYAAKDTEMTWKLYEFQKHHMLKMPTVYEYYTTVEIPLLYVIVALEANGYILDLGFAKDYQKRLHTRIGELEDELIRELMPYHDKEETINLNSSQQMRPALSKLIGRELPNMDAKKTLKPLRNSYDIIDNLLEYKKLTKLAGTYIDSLPNKQNPTTKRWHSRFNVMGTVTGRFSSGKDEEDKVGQGFNVQNQPPEARPMFVAPKGKVIVGADFKAQEIRCVAYMSGEPVLIQAFKENRDPYAMMASTFYERPYEDVYKTADGDDTPERKKMKVVWLATLYGMSDKSLGDSLGISVKEATAFKDDLFGSMPKLNAWLEGNKDFVKRYGYVWADKRARKRRLPAARWQRKRVPWGKYWDDAYKEQRIHNAKIGTAFRQATNARVQGSSSIQTKVTMIKAHEFCESNPGWAVWGTIHDEILFEVPEDFTPEEGEEIRRIMVESYPWGDGEVENGTDIEVMRRWGEGVSLEEWFNKTT